MSILIVGVLAIVQGFAELLPVSSSAHVILVEKLLGLDPTAPEMTFLIVMLHTGTMFAVLTYFWNRWKKRLSGDRARRRSFIWMLIVATAATGAVGLALQWIIEKVVLGGSSAAVEDIFGNTALIGASLMCVGILIIVSGRLERAGEKKAKSSGPIVSSLLIGTIQGLSLPFRGFSRSGSTISVGLLRGMQRDFAEEFSFFLAAILTLPVVGREALRLRASAPGAGAGTATPWLMGGCGLLFSFAAGLVAIRWLSAWLDRGRWSWFGVYCLAMAALILALRFTGILA